LAFLLTQVRTSHDEFFLGVQDPETEYKVNENIIKFYLYRLEFRDFVKKIFYDEKGTPWHYC